MPCKTVTPSDTDFDCSQGQMLSLTVAMVVVPFHVRILRTMKTMQMTAKKKLTSTQLTKMSCTEGGGSIRSRDGHGISRIIVHLKSSCR